jgi:magnesium-transporting ATPase (P-type)
MLVKGDIVYIEAGNRIPADIRIFESKELRVDESMLTGESVPQSKHNEPIKKEGLIISDQKNMAFSGSYVTSGFGLGYVVSTGMDTEYGKISLLIKNAREITTPLMKKISIFTKKLIIFIICLGAVNLFLSMAIRMEFSYAFLTSVSIIVAAIPEMLPTIIVISLGISAMQMAKKRAIIRNLPAAETLGSTSVICTDKTGTLTKNQMTVVKIFAGKSYYNISGTGYEPKGDFFIDGEEKDTKRIGKGNIPLELSEGLVAGYNCNDAQLVKSKGNFQIIGDPTEGALLVSATKLLQNKELPKLDEIPFDSNNNYMATLHKGKDSSILYVKGSPEKILGFCSKWMVNSKRHPINRKTLHFKAHKMASEALRVLGVAYKEFPKNKKDISTEDIKDLTFLCFQGMIDPPREEIKEAIAKCNNAGIRVVMITGDHIGTAVAIAKEIGILKDKDRFISGDELSKLSDDELYAEIDKISVYARTTPLDKLRITTQLQRKGHVVAMTGDGINDAPALKKADIGISMGITGTEVTKEASDMVIMDDNFATIVNAVDEGRNVWKNFQKAIYYTLPTNGGQSLLIMVAILLIPLIPLFGIKLPLEPIHILWINLADSIFFTLPLIMEPKEKNLLKEKPTGKNESIVNKFFFRRVGLVSLLMTITGFLVYLFLGSRLLANGAPEGSLVMAQTITFLSIQFLHIGFLLTSRDIYKSAFKINPFSNKWIWLGIIANVSISLFMIYNPLMQSVFRVMPVPLGWWFIPVIAFFVGFIPVEIEKALWRRNI